MTKHTMLNDLKVFRKRYLLLRHYTTNKKQARNLTTEEKQINTIPACTGCDCMVKGNKVHTHHTQTG